MKKPRKPDKHTKAAQKLLLKYQQKFPEGAFVHPFYLRDMIASALRRVARAEYRKGYNEAGYYMLNPNRKK